MVLSTVSSLFHVPNLYYGNSTGLSDSWVIMEVPPLSPAPPAEMTTFVVSHGLTVSKLRAGGHR